MFAKLDMNVPIDKNTGEIIDTEKILDGVKCIEWCFEEGANKVIAISHQGRKKEETLKNHVKVLEKYFPNRVKFCPSVVDLVNVVKDANEKYLIVLENIRSGDEEKGYDDVTKTNLYKAVKNIEKISGKKIVYVKDDIAVCHRKDLSVYGLPLQLKNEGYDVLAGPCIKVEIEKARNARERIENRKLICVWGGGKFEDYLHLFKPFLNKYKNAIVLTSGPLSVLFLKARGINIGVNESVFEIDEEAVSKTKSIIEEYGTRIVTPMDYSVENTHGNEIVDNIENLKGLVVDIGPTTIKNFRHIIKSNPSSTIISNGPLGQYEKVENFQGTSQVYQEIFKEENKNFVIGGGGDFNAMMNILELEPHIRSVGGKAFLELLVHGTLPGLEPLNLSL